MIQPNILVRIQPRLTQNYTYIVPTYPWEKTIDILQYQLAIIYLQD